MTEPIRLITHDAPYAIGRATSGKGTACWTVRLRLADGQDAYIEMGAESLDLFRRVALDAAGEPVLPQMVGLDARLSCPVPAGERGQLALELGEAAG